MRFIKTVFLLLAVCLLFACASAPTEAPIRSLWRDASWSDTDSALIDTCLNLPVSYRADRYGALSGRQYPFGAGAGDFHYATAEAADLYFLYQYTMFSEDGQKDYTFVFRVDAADALFVAESYIAGAPMTEAALDNWFEVWRQFDS